MRPMLAIFDLDGTLLPPPSTEVRFAASLIGTGVIGPRQLASYLAFAVSRWPRHRGRIWKLNKAYLDRLAVEDIESRAGAFVRQNLLPRLRPTLLAHLHRHQDARDPVLLLTGAPDFLARPVCHELGIAHCIATACTVRNGRFAAAAPRMQPLGREKRALAEAFCARNGLSLHEACAYCDSVNDLPLLEVVGRAVAVCPDTGLARRAAQRGWSTLCS